MHINVRHLLAEDVGHSETFKITAERPELESVRLTQDIEGEITISRLDSSLVVRGNISTEVELECHRCLSTFSRPITVSFSQNFSEQPTDDDMPIVDETIDLVPLIKQEIILGLPIKLLCREDCRGIENAPDTYTKEETQHRLQDQARITKGS